MRQLLEARRARRSILPRRILALTTVAFGVLLATVGAFAVAWHLTEWDAPVVGVSPLRDEDPGETSNAASGSGATENEAPTSCLPVRDIGAPGPDPSRATAIRARGLSCPFAQAVARDYLQIMASTASSIEEPVEVKGLNCVSPSPSRAQCHAPPNGSTSVTFKVGAPSKPNDFEPPGGLTNCGRVPEDVGVVFDTMEVSGIDCEEGFALTGRLATNPPPPWTCKSESGYYVCRNSDTGARIVY